MATTLEDVITAHAAIAAATANYQETLRAALADGVTQVSIARELGVSDEKLRLDALTDEQRAAIRERNRTREAGVRKRARAAAA